MTCVLNPLGSSRLLPGCKEYKLALTGRSSLGSGVSSCPSQIYEVTHVFIVVHTFRKVLASSPNPYTFFYRPPRSLGLTPTK